MPRFLLGLSSLVSGLSLVAALMLVSVETYAGTSPTIKLPKKTITVFTVSIERPKGDPLTAGSVDNQFTYTGTNGVATIAVEAKVLPTTLAAVGDLIKWSFVSIPAGSTLSWNNSWPGDPTSGKGLSAVATIAGYPIHNDQFGRKTIKMEVIRNGKAIITKTADIALFYERDVVAVTFSAPNWFRYWSETAAGNANEQYSALANDFGQTPAMLDWPTYGGPRRRILIGDSARLSDTRRDGSGQVVTGIDLFANTVLHENYHVQQIYDNNALPFFLGRTGTLRDAPSAGWSFNVAFSPASLWNHFMDNNANSTFDEGDANLDANFNDLGDSLEPTAAQRAQCASGSNNNIECQAELHETNPQDNYWHEDWGDPGKRHLTRAYDD